MEERTKKEIAERFIKFCERFMNLYVKNYELIQFTEICDLNLIAAYYKTEMAIYTFVYDFDWYFLDLEKSNMIVTNELINGHKLFKLYNFKKRKFQSYYIAGLKTWE